MPTEVITNESENAEEFALSEGERCDASASERAVARVWFGETAMHFCGHHLRKNLEHFVAAGYKIEAPSGVAQL